MDEEEQQQSDSKINVGSFFERVDSVDRVANRALSQSNKNFSAISSQQTFINSINISIEALETKVRDIANYIIIEKRIEKDAKEDELVEQQDKAQKGSMLERLAGLKSNNESEQTQAAGEEPKKGGGGILGTLLTLGIGAFALKFLWPAILPAVGGLLKGALAKFAMFSIGGIGSLIKSIIVGSGLTGISVFGIGKLFQKFGDSAENRGNKVAESASNAIKNFKFNEDGKVDGPNKLEVGGGEGGGEEGGEEGGERDFGDDYKKKEEDAFKAAEAYKAEKSNLNIEKNSAVNDMNKTLEKKDLKKKEKTTYTKEQVLKMVEEYKRLVKKEVAASQGSGDELTPDDEFDMKKLKIILDKIGIETRYGEIQGSVEQFNQAIEDYDKKVGGTGVKEAPIYGDVGGLIKTVEPKIENKDLDLGMSDTFSDKFQSLNEQVDMLSEDLTGTINTESGQMFSRPANSPNTTVTVFKQTSSNTPFTNLMSNKYLSLNKTLPPEVYRAIK